MKFELIYKNKSFEASAPETGEVTGFQLADTVISMAIRSGVVSEEDQTALYSFAGDAFINPNEPSVFPNGTITFTSKTPVELN